MLGVYVSVPIACFRKGLAREYLETEVLPPPATCYGALLSLVGETDRRSHLGVRVCPVLLNNPELSVVLRTVWRVKSKPLGSSGNTRPDYQQLLASVQILIWVDSSGELGPRLLEDRIQQALKRPSEVNRYGGLCLGESTHLVDEVSLYHHEDPRFSQLPKEGRAFLRAERGRLTLPVWVDHVGSAGTKYVTGNLVPGPLIPPLEERMPQILQN